MLRHFCLTAVALVALCTTAAAQGETPAVAGNWNGKAMIGPKDTVVTTFVLMLSSSDTASTTTFPNREPLETHIVDMRGDSVVTEIGPYPSLLRPDQTVTSLRMISHFKGDVMWGTFEATYENGDVLKGKTKATRAK
jgi:hypothetical protein